MRTRIVEVSNGINWGRFLIGRFEADEWLKESACKADGYALRILGSGGNSLDCFLMLDLVTGEGAIFEPNGLAAADLSGGKHQIWVCPLFEPALEWIYENKRLLEDLSQLPDLIELPNAPSALHGYRRRRRT